MDPDDDDGGDFSAFQAFLDEQKRRERLHLLTMALDRGLVLYQDPNASEYHTFQYTPPDSTWPFVHVSRMIFNWRLSEYDGYMAYGRFWCFGGVSTMTFAAALNQLAIWQGNPATEPQGWIKSWNSKQAGRLVQPAGS